MDVRFLGQPFSDQANLSDFISHATTAEFDRLQIAVAWAKRSGLERVRADLATFRSQGGRVEVILGVSEGGATRRGLELAIELSDQAYVYHHQGRTFHPKVYLASGPEHRSMLVGSSNMTAGGLAWNYEASLWVDDPGAVDTHLWNQVDAWFERLRTEEGACVRLTDTVVDRLAATRGIILGSESRSRPTHPLGQPEPEDSDSVALGPIDLIFTGVESSFRRLPPLGETTPRSESTKAVDPAALGENGVARPGQDPIPLETLPIARRWYSKALNHTQAQQQKSQNTRVKGSMTLTKAGADIDHLTYFRDEFFGDLAWSASSRGGDQVEAYIMTRVWIDGHDLGFKELRISHAPHRAASQGNVPTWLHWEDVGSYLRANNYVGFYAVLDRLDDGEFRLLITRTQPPNYI